ncbi:MAG: galactose mutarotase [Lachnospiraceae bacterium]|nr:galactose mutarotase [Lachnospiraceae bacterium]
MSITKSKFGVDKAGNEVTKYTLKNKNGMEVSFINLGAVITNIVVPGRDGVFEDIALGYDETAPYEVNKPSFGAPIGRYSNRVSNAKFVLNGKEYKLDQNDETNCLHGGNLRYNCCMYNAEYEEFEEEDKIIFSRHSPDGEQGFPGNLDYSVTYILDDDDELIIGYNAECDQDTIVNFTNHTYFNLGKGGHKCPDVLDQEVQIEADYYTPVNDILVPTGELKELASTALDFREFKKLRDGIGKEDAYGNIVAGYDYNFVLRTDGKDAIRKAAQFRDNSTGRIMEVFTDQPGMQLYTANDLDIDGCKEGVHYGNFCGACFETQNFPNAINTEGFPNAVLKAGEQFKSITVYRFKTF